MTNGTKMFSESTVTDVCCVGTSYSAWACRITPTHKHAMALNGKINMIIKVKRVGQGKFFSPFQHSTLPSTGALYVTWRC